MPKVPLTENIGFDSEASMMKSRPASLIEGGSTGARRQLSANENPFLSERGQIVGCYEFDRLCEKYIYRISLFAILKLIVKNIIWKKRSWTKI
jgi:hypothetical protein